MLTQSPPKAAAPSDRRCTPAGKLSRFIKMTNIITVKDASLPCCSRHIGTGLSFVLHPSQFSAPAAFCPTSVQLYFPEQKVSSASQGAL